MIRKIKELASGVLAFWKEGCWQVDVGALGFFRRTGVNLIRFFSTMFRSFGEHRCALQAAGLTYFSILGFIPVLCMLMVCAKACGVGNFARDKINEQIDAFITQVEKGQEEVAAAAAKVTSSETATEKPEEGAVKPEAVDAQPDSAESSSAQKTLAGIPIVVDDKEQMARYKAQVSKDIALQVRKFSNETFDRIDEVDLTTLGWIGFGLLMWTVVSTLGHVETAVNDVWLVRKDRPVWRKFIVYLFIVIVVPVFMSLAVSLPIIRLAKTALDVTLGATSYTRWVGDALVNLLTSRLFGFFITLVFSALAFAVLLKMMPNRRVSFRSAFRAGVFTALLTGVLMKLCTTAGVGVSKWGAMYGSFAAVPIVLAWIYMSWQIVLLGSCMSYAFECLHRGTPVLSDG